MDTFYTESPLWHEKIGQIHALLERVKISEEQHGDVLRLRKLNRIMSIHASTAIEGNRLTLGQVQDVINGIPVWGPHKDVKEVQNAWLAYNGIEVYAPWSVESLLKTHALMTNDLVGESGVFRSVDVAVVGGDGRVLHRGAKPSSVPGMVADLFDWGKQSLAHPLIKSSAVHFMLEYIHPFRDGNGRMGRLWQTLILSKWKPLFAWLPVETLVHYNQALYYKALQDSHSGKLDCKPFIDSMLDMIENSMYKFIDVASETKYGAGMVLETLPVAPRVAENGGANFAVNVGVNIENVSVNVGVKAGILERLKNQPSLSADELGKILGKSRRTIERHIRGLREQSLLVRIGSDKSGYWEVR